MLGKSRKAQEDIQKGTETKATQCRARRETGEAHPCPHDFSLHTTEVVGFVDGNSLVPEQVVRGHEMEVEVGEAICEDGAAKVEGTTTSEHSCKPPESFHSSPHLPIIQGKRQNEKRKSTHLVAV